MALTVTTAPAGPVASAVVFRRLIVGGFAATYGVTVTVKLADAALACASAAEHDTAVGPTGKVEPDAGAQLTATLPSTRSLADAAKLTNAPDALVAAIVMFAGTATTGATLSRTVTGNTTLAVSPAWFVAEQLTIVRPIGKMEPDAGAHVTGVTPSTGSIAFAWNVTTLPVHSSLRDHIAWNGDRRR